MICPCKDCSNRVMNCHSSCEQYKEYKNKLAEISEAKHKEIEYYGFEKSARQFNKKKRR